MNTSEITKHTIKKTFSMRFRVLAVVILSMIAVAIIIGGLCLYEVDNYIQSQAEDFVKVTCDNEGTKINDSLKNMEKSFFSLLTNTLCCDIILLVSRG